MHKRSASCQGRAEGGQYLCSREPWRAVPPRSTSSVRSPNLPSSELASFGPTPLTALERSSARMSSTLSPAAAAAATSFAGSRPAQIALLTSPMSTSFSGVVRFFVSGGMRASMAAELTSQSMRGTGIASSLSSDMDSPRKRPAGRALTATRFAACRSAASDAGRDGRRVARHSTIVDKTRTKRARQRAARRMQRIKNGLD